MHRILFVDDEPAVLEGLRNLFRKQRRRWEMVFAPGGREALDELQRTRFDVVVSDMRMPGIDGAELLRRVKDGYPSVARIVLSGHAEPEAVARVLPVANGYVAKPCDADALRVLIERGCGLHDLLEDENVRRAAAKLGPTPSAPITYLEVTRAVASPELRAEELEEILGRDASVATRFLQLANATCFGLTQPTSSVATVAALLDPSSLRALSLLANALAVLERAGPIDAGLLERALASTTLSARIARRIAGAEPAAGEAFAAALVHDVGRPILALEFGADLEEVVRRAAAEGRPHWLAEREAFAVSHAEVGAYLLARWGLPLHVVEAVAHHHAPSRVRRADFGVLEVVHVAGALAADVLGECPAAALELDTAHLDALGVVDRIPSWKAIAGEELRRCSRTASGGP